jgi:AcrR family transcriptional regulator
VAPNRGPRPSLELSQLAVATTAVADEEGLAAVSMQKVAARLGVTKMALYRYVGSKDELVAVAVEHAVGDPPVLTGDGDWRTRTLRWAELLREVWQRHPWLPGATLGNRMIGPREIGWSESAAQALQGSGLTGDELRTTIALLFATSRAALAHDVAGTQYWTTQPQVGAELRERLRGHADRFPLVSAAEAGATRDFDAWRFGLDLVLDGVAARPRD